MAVQTKHKMSADSYGAGILLTSSYTNLHVTGTSQYVIDELWLYGTNKSTSVSRTVTIRFQDGTNTRTINQTIPYSSGLTLIVPGFVFTGTDSSSLTVSAIDSSNSGDIYLFGYVNRTTP